MLKLDESKIPSLTHVEREALNQLKIRIRNHFFVYKIILFGSKARGDFSGDSDVDILVIVEDEDNQSNRLKLYKLTFQINLEFLTDFSCKLRNKTKWETGEGQFPAFIKDVMEEGIDIGL